MSIKEKVQDAMKEALRQKDRERLEALRMAKGALLLKEKESSSGLSDESAIAVLRSEVKKRQQSIEVFREHGKEEQAQATEREIAVLEEFLPQQLLPEQVEEKVRAYVAEHPEIDHPGKLTGALKKELGDLVDGKVLNDICRKVLEA